jgi:GNAT superfamily N-acetyltransferase
MTFDVVRGDLRYVIDDDAARIDREVVWQFLSTEAYWGRWRERADLEKQLDSAWRMVGAYDSTSALVGFARAVSDGVILGYVADVFVLPGHRGRGLAQAIITELVENGPGSDFRWMLHTADAHDLYRKFGFTEPNSRYLERPSSRPAPG